MSFVTAAPGAEPIIVEAAFPVDPSRVFRAWTEPEQVKKWFGSQPGALESAAIDLRPGGEWRFTEHVSTAGSAGFEGHYIEVEIDTVLVFSWSKFTEHASGDRTATEQSRVEVRFTPTASGTRMRIVHSALNDVRVREDFALGWERAMSNLASAVEP